MTDIINFNGSVWGATTKGTVFMEMLRTGNHIEGRLCVMEPGLGQLNALFVGEWSAENRIRVTINQFTGAYNVPVTLPQTGRMDGTFDPTEHGRADIGQGSAGEDREPAASRAAGSCCASRWSKSTSRTSNTSRSNKCGGSPTDHQDRCLRLL